ncbi:hypothetical protein [Streptomyces anulatus]|uniref:hypothetical protein n=1 Tax=Streptomyces anulatus TaxID=1892 RepID=UPI0004CB4892|nr:hypothetical protein [Streptomyces anulatus]
MYEPETLDGVEAHLSRAIRQTGRGRVAVSWMVLEERAAHWLFTYSDAHEKLLWLSGDFSRADAFSGCETK